MIKNILKIILKIIGAILIVGALIWVLSVVPLGKASDFARDIRSTVEQFFGPEKEAAEQAVSSQAQRIAEEFGLDEDQVAEFLEKHHIEGLEVIDLPEDAVVQKSAERTIAGVEVTLTLYRDPGYITLSYQGHVITFSVPEKAQRYVALWALS